MASAHTRQSGFIMCVQLLSWTELPCQHMQHMGAQALVRKVRGCHSNDLQPSYLSTLSTLYLPMDSTTTRLVAGPTCAMAGAVQDVLSWSCPKLRG